MAVVYDDRSSSTKSAYRRNIIIIISGYLAAIAAPVVVVLDSRVFDLNLGSQTSRRRVFGSLLDGEVV